MADIIDFPELPDLRSASGRDWLRSIISAEPDAMRVITVNGDSMFPTLADGDTILVDTDQNTVARDGIYVVRFGEFKLIKRLRVDPDTPRVTISSDNANYPALAPVEPSDVDLVGRVIWLARRLSDATA